VPLTRRDGQDSHASPIPSASFSLAPSLASYYPAPVIIGNAAFAPPPTRPSQPQADLSSFVLPEPAVDGQIPNISGWKQAVKDWKYADKPLCAWKEKEIEWCKAAGHHSKYSQQKCIGKAYWDE
jgi:hypothetical protein